MKTAVITGASSGLGAELAKMLAERGWDLILAARRTERLQELAGQLPVHCTVVTADLSKRSECERLYELAKDSRPQLLINNAGFGLLGDFDKSDLDREMDMLAVNCGAVHILMKLFLPDFIERNEGCILNVASVASYMSGPLMASYYASKAYVLKLSLSVAGELRKRGSAVKVCALCPGPFSTEFNRVADVSFSIKGKSPRFVAERALRGIERGKAVIVPGLLIKAAIFASRFAPQALISDLCYRIQRKKTG